MLWFTHAYYTCIMKTKLLYLEFMHKYVCEAQAVEVVNEEGREVVILDQTVFYPQGGGQPYDTGVISRQNSTFHVEEVRAVDGRVKHIGKFENEAFEVGESVTCNINIERRLLNTRLHSAGHIVDMGMKRLDIPWVPGKGYHFPNGPYVEYSGSLVGVDTEKLKADLETACNQIISEGIETKVVFTADEEVAGKPARVVMYGDFSIPCGGTHVSNLKEIGAMTIRKIKRDGENIRVSYNCL